MRRLTWLIALVAFVVASLAAAPVTAQDATPAANGFPLTADPALCTVEPRDVDELLDIWFPPNGTPEATPAVAAELPTEITIPLGEPADDDTVAGVTLTVHEVFSCFAAGDYRRVAALFTDDLARQFGPGPEETWEQVTAFLEATPVPEAGAGGSQIVAITDVMLLGDGRVGAFVVDRGPEGTHTAYAIFEQAEDRWLVDEVIEFSPGAE